MMGGYPVAIKFGDLVIDPGKWPAGGRLHEGTRLPVQQARSVLTRATQSLTTRYPMIHFNLHRLDRLEARTPEWEHELAWRELDTLEDRELPLSFDHSARLPASNLAEQPPACDGPIA